MKPKNMVDKIIGNIKISIKSLSAVSSFLLGAMILIVVANVVGRFLFNLPVFGTIELVELMMVIICFFAIPYTSMNRGHVRITLFINLLPKRVQKILGRISSLLTVGIFSIITYQAAVNTWYYFKNLNHCTDIFEFPLAPFRAVMFLGFVILLFIELIHVFRPLPPEEDMESLN